jgi:voltage-gated potassium channel
MTPQQRQNIQHSHHLTSAVILLLLIVFIGIFGYMFLEGYSFLDAIYMTVITVATVGYREVHELSQTGKIFTIFLIISSMGIFAYAVSNIAIYAVEGIFANYFRENKLKRMIKKMEDHVIVCGFGRNGKEAALTLAEENQKFIIIEQKEQVASSIAEHYPDFVYIIGDATNEEVLLQAGVKKAKAIITTLPIDADNIYIILTAREFNPGIKIISRASEEHADGRLVRAGADKVIMPDKIGGQRMAKLVTQPDTIEFLEYIILQTGSEINLTEIPCGNIENCDLTRTIGDLDLRRQIGINIIGIKTKEGSYIFNPTPDLRVKQTDKLFVLGTKDQIKNFKLFLEGQLNFDDENS